MIQLFMREKRKQQEVTHLKSKLNTMIVSERLNKIMNNELFKRNMSLIEIKEKRRKYCKHDFRHLIDTARIAHILNLENHLGIQKDVVYAAALLHDVGKIVEYDEGLEHHVVGAELCVEILREAGYSDQEVLLIKKAILKHRDPNVRQELSLSGIIYCADKLSRPCLDCKVQPKCDWDEEKKNMQILY